MKTEWIVKEQLGTKEKSYINLCWELTRFQSKYIIALKGEIDYTLTSKNGLLLDEEGDEEDDEETFKAQLFNIKNVQKISKLDYESKKYQLQLFHKNANIFPNRTISISHLGNKVPNKQSVVLGTSYSLKTPA